MSDYNEMAIEEVQDQSWKPKVLIGGAVLGAAIGALAAYLLIQNADEDAGLEMGPGEGIKIGVLVFGLLRSIANLVED